MIQKHERNVAVVVSVQEYNHLKLDYLRTKLSIGEDQADKTKFSDADADTIKNKGRKAYEKKL